MHYVATHGHRYATVNHICNKRFTEIYHTLAYYPHPYYAHAYTHAIEVRGCFLGLGLASTENLSYQTSLVADQTTLVPYQTTLVPDQRDNSRCLACEMFGQRVRDSDVALRLLHKIRSQFLASCARVNNARLTFRHATAGYAILLELLFSALSCKNSPRRRSQ